MFKQIYYVQNKHQEKVADIFFTVIEQEKSSLEQIK